MTKINGGATIWARQTIESNIFYNKPDKWFKIWFYLVNMVNHKSSKKFERATCFMKYQWIMDATGATKNQVKHCIDFFKKDKMLATQKATRGFIIKVLNYNDYQNLENYRSHTESHLKATQKPHRSHTRNNNVNNVNNDKKKKEKLFFSFTDKKFVKDNILLYTKNNFEDRYPHTNVYIEIEKMENWLMVEYEKKKAGKKNKLPKEDYNKFIHNWLRKHENENIERGINEND